MTNGLRKNLTVVDSGENSFTVTMNIHPDRAASGAEVPEHTQQDVDNLRDEVQRILTGATESGSSAAKILRTLVDEAKHGFAGGEVYEDRDAAAKPIEEGERYATLMKEKGDDMTPEQLADLNKTLEKYRDDPLFQERFATTLGPRGVLDFWMDLSDPSDGGDLQRAARDRFGDLQRNISLTLAGATQSDSPAMQQWQNDMLALGDECIKVRGGEAYGFQIMSNFMRAGDYGNTFMNNYGDALVATEKKMKLPDHYWRGWACRCPSSTSSAATTSAATR
ncbi:hypothetical protein ACIREE_27580 [Streptomyces sp. NPDC102467]|uniref:hypothetical protein n=1 Tax=Streptomyces sp. NPDC102467 TaxID=3366179 RepID=UPI0038131945